MMSTTFHLIISGRVQGVGYRAWVLQQARKLGLSGWVRNRRDGTVEALVSGDADMLESMVEACHEGPIAARVDRVSVHEVNEAVPEGFAQKETV